MFLQTWQTSTSVDMVAMGDTKQKGQGHCVRSLSIFLFSPLRPTQFACQNCPHLAQSSFHDDSSDWLQGHLSLSLWECWMAGIAACGVTFSSNWDDIEEASDSDRDDDLSFLVAVLG